MLTIVLVVIRGVYFLITCWGRFVLSVVYGVGFGDDTQSGRAGDRGVCDCGFVMGFRYS